MSVVKILDDVTDWAKHNICSKIELKVPPKSGEPNDHDYDYKTARPVAFTMYVPTDDKLPKDIPSAFPSLCVRFIEGADDAANNKGSIGIQFLLSAWNPGTHSQERFTVQNNDPTQWAADSQAGEPFERNGDGWRDIWNFADIAIQAVESVTNISGYEIDRTVPVKFGPLTEQEAVPDFYPFWFAWVSFQLTYPLQRKIQDVQEFL